MSNKPTAVDQTEEEILTYETSDDALETAAATPANMGAYSFSFCTSDYVCPWS
jgi:hypothetical protein